MTYELMNTILTATGIPFTYLQFKNPPTGDKYIAYFESEKLRFLADNKVYHFEPTFAVELYTKIKDNQTEEALIALFDQYEVAWAGGQSVWIESEKMYQTVFYC